MVMVLLLLCSEVNEKRERDGGSVCFNVIVFCRVAPTTLLILSVKTDAPACKTGTAWISGWTYRAGNCNILSSLEC